MDYSFSIRWSNQSISDLQEILHYLEERWSNREVNQFKAKLGKDIELLAKFPYLGATSKSKPALRRFVLSKHVAIIYQVSNNSITIISLFQSAKNPKF